jgi:hypothetical protein
MLIRILFFSLLLAPIAGWALYKPLRVVVPEWNGVECVGEVICVEDRERAEEAKAVYVEALAFVDASAGEIHHKPRATFCSSEACFSAFGFHSPAKAKTVGVAGIVVGPLGWNQHILRHEIIHHLQAERLGVIGQLLSPKWFKEGMAYSLSEDPRELKEPWESYRNAFLAWFQRVGKERLWNEAKRL